MAYPKSEDKKIRNITKILVNYCERNDLKFSFGGEELYAVEAFSDFGGLSLILFEAKELYEKLYNNLFTVEDLMSEFRKNSRQLTDEQREKEEEYLKKQIIKKVFPVEFYAKENETFFGFLPKMLNSSPGDFIQVAYFSQYSLEEYVKQFKLNKMLLIEGKIPLDPLFEKLSKKVKNKEVLILPPLDMKLKDK